MKHSKAGFKNQSTKFNKQSSQTPCLESTNLWYS